METNSAAAKSRESPQLLVTGVDRNETLSFQNDLDEEAKTGALETKNKDSGQIEITNASAIEADSIDLGKESD